VELRLEEIMNASPVTTAPGVSLTTVAACMRRRGVGSAVVVSDGAVVGIVTERDVTRAVAAGADATTAPVEAWMSRDPLTVSPRDDLTHALDRMIERNFRHLPVCDQGRLVGMVSLRQLVRAASVRRVDPWTPGSNRGLENVTIGETRLSHIDGNKGRLLYAGYDAVEFALHRSFEDVWHLLYTGELPPDDTFARRTASLRGVPLPVTTLRALARCGGSAMSRLQAAVAAAGAAWDLRPWHGRDLREVAEEGVRLGAVIPTLVCALWRLGRGLDPMAPDPALGHAANHLWMLHGRRPSSAETVALDRYLVLTADHGMNASTFTARVIASTGADVAAAVAGAVGAFSGPLHGGSPALVLDMLDEIRTPERARDWVRNAIAQGRRLMGFGHRVYRTEDPRATCFRETVTALGSERLELAGAVEEAALAELRVAKPGRALYTNVEFYAALLLERAGIPRELFTPTFAVARTVGWTAHVLEQARDNRLIRPTADYVGPVGRELGRPGSRAQLR
jgi:citrate synthase